MSGKFLFPLYLALFLEISPIISFWTCFFISLFRLTFCVCFYVLGRTAMTPSLGMMALCSRCPVGPHGEISFITCAGCSIQRIKEWPLCGLCGSSCYNWVLIAIGLFLCGVNPQAGWLWASVPITVYELLCMCWLQVWSSPQEGLVSSEIFLWICHLWSLLNPSLTLSEADHWVLVLGLLGRDSSADQCQKMPVIGCDLPVWRYKAIHSMWLPLLGLGMYGEDPAVHQDQLLPAAGPEAGQQKFQRVLRSSSTCLSILAAC